MNDMLNINDSKKHYMQKYNRFKIRHIKKYNVCKYVCFY